MYEPTDANYKIYEGQIKHEFGVLVLNITCAIYLVFMLYSNIEEYAFLLHHFSYWADFFGVLFWDHRDHFGLQKNTRRVNWSVGNNDQGHDVVIINPSLEKYLVDIGMGQDENPLLCCKLLWGCSDFIEALLFRVFNTFYVAEQTVDWDISNEVFVV